MSSIGERINLVRKNLGLTMEEFGELFSPPANKSNVSRWEKDKALPNNERLKEIAKIGNISVEELIYGDERYYINPLIVNIAANQYNLAIEDDQDMINHIFNRLDSYSYDSTEEELYSENKEIFDNILLYPFAMDSEGLVKTTTLDLFHSMNKIKEFTEERKDAISKEEYKDLQHTCDLILEILQQAYYDIEGLKIDPQFSSVLKFQAELEQEIDQHANSEILDPKHD